MKTVKKHFPPNKALEDYCNFTIPFSPHDQVSVTDGVPALVQPLKPKFYLTCSTMVPAGHAVKLV